MIDLIAAREKFDNSTDFTVGIEEEFALVDPTTLELIAMFERLRDAAADDPILSQSIAGELISSEIEIRSGAGKDIDDALFKQRECRRRLFKLAAKHGVQLAATGTHPLSDYRHQHIIDTPHYERVERELHYVAWRNNTFSLHVHVGVRGADRAIQVCDRLRPILPLLLCLSANSPFLDGADSGLHSGRTQTFTKSFPRCGIPDAFGSWAAWEQYIDLLVRTNSIIEFTQVWWSVRPHHQFGTVEVRICDAQMTAGEAEGLTSLIVNCVKAAARDVDSGEQQKQIPGRLIEENMWRAIRYGMDGKLLDLEADLITEFDAIELPARLAQWIGEPVELTLPNGAQRQRRMIEAGATPIEVMRACVDETQATYYQPDEEAVA